MHGKILITGESSAMRSLVFFVNICKVKQNLKDWVVLGVLCNHSFKVSWDLSCIPKSSLRERDKYQRILSTGKENSFKQGGVIVLTQHEHTRYSCSLQHGR